MRRHRPGRVPLAVADPTIGGRALKLTRAQDARVTRRVPLRDRARQDTGDDLGAAPWTVFDARSRPQTNLVQIVQRAKTDDPQTCALSPGEGSPGRACVTPSVVALATPSYYDHGDIVSSRGQVAGATGQVDSDFIAAPAVLALLLLVQQVPLQV
jgi:hypothetical protein